MKKLWEQFRTPGLNYRAMYDERKNRLVSVPAIENVKRHLALTILYSLLTLAVSGLLVTGVGMLLGALGMGEGIPRDIISAIPSGILLVAAFVVYAPRLGLFPGIFGAQLILDENDTYDKQVAKIIKANPSRFNVDWYRDWAEASARRREDLIKELKDSLRQVKKATKTK